MTTPQQQIIDKCRAIFARATELFGLDLSQVAIQFDLKGRSAGMACRRSGQYSIRFNRDMLTREAFKHLLENTVPHEIAHIVCFMNPRLGCNHNSGWARVCQQLGGTGARCHKEEIVFAKGTTYEYITDFGNKVRMGDRHHLLVQAGHPLRYRKGLGTVTKNCQYSVVGVQGRTLAVPRAVVPSVPAAVVHEPVPQAKPAAVTKTAVSFASGASKASVSRSIMLAGHARGQTYEQIILAMMTACGYDRQLARATYKANYMKVGCPAP